MQSKSRRAFLKNSGAVSAGTVAIGWAGSSVADSHNVERATLQYPEKAIGNISKLIENQPADFLYPDDASPCTLIKTGQPVPGGIGPDRDIVAFSTLCTHMGCPLVYDADSRRFKCGCHYSMFDPEMSGQQICGQATENLPRIELVMDAADGVIRAVSIHGHIYGRLANTL